MISELGDTITHRCGTHVYIYVYMYYTMHTVCDLFRFISHPLEWQGWPDDIDTTAKDAKKDSYHNPS